MIGTGADVLPTHILAGAAEACARFLLHSMRCGFALTPFNHSNEMIGPTRIFDSDGGIMAEVGEADEVEGPEEG